MTELMSLLYEYAQNHYVMGLMDARAYREAERLEEKNFAALKKDLSSEGLAALERYQDTCLEREAMEREAAFLAGFSLARELWV